MVNGLPTASSYSSSDNALAQLHEGKRREEWEGRRDQCRMTRQVWEGCFEHYVTETLRNRFATKTFELLKLDAGVKTENRLLNDIITKRAVAASEGARCWQTNEAGAEVTTDELRALLEEMDVDNLLKSFDVETEQHGTVLCMVDVAESMQTGERTLTYTLHSAETCDVFVNPKNPLDWYAAALFDSVLVDDKTERRRATLWFADRWEIWVEYRAEKWRMTDTGPNPYGIVPGELVHRSKPVKSLWVDGLGPQLARLTININAWETFTDLLAANYVKVVAGPLSKEAFPGGQYLRPGGALDTGNSTTVQVLDLQQDLAQFVNVKIERPRQIAAISAGLRADEFQAGGEPPSGESLRLQYWNRDRQAVDKQSQLIKALKRIYDITWWVLYVELGRAGAPPIRGITALPPGTPPAGAARAQRVAEDGSTTPLTAVPAASPWRFHVDINEMTYPELQTERSTRLKEDLTMGFTSRVAEIMHEKGLSEPEAWTYLETNLATEDLLSNRARIKLDAKKRGIRTIIKEGAAAGGGRERIEQHQDARNPAPPGSEGKG